MENRYGIENIAKFNQKEYNSANEITLPKNEYGRLSDIIDSNTNITLVLNKVILLDKTYYVYYNCYNKFKIIYSDNNVDYCDEVNNYGINGNADNLDKGNETTRSRSRHSQFSYGEVENGRKTTRNDGLSDINTRQDSKQEYSYSKSNRNQKQELDNSSFFIENK